jgi:hypothetical protein
MSQRRFFVATGMLVFDFELFIGVPFQIKKELTALSGCPPSYDIEWFVPT